MAQEGDETRPAGTTAASFGGLRIVFALPVGVREVPLDDRPLVIGRHAQCDLSLPDDSLSRRHARVTPGAPPLIEDLGSRNGTLVMGTRLLPGQQAALKAGMLVQLGTALGVVQRVASAGQGMTSSASGARGGAASFIGESAAARQLRHLAGTIAPTTLPILVLGETGTGKDVYAEALHQSSQRSEMPLVRLNCAAFTESLLESELFGHERGAFTGAHNAKAGLFEAADGGTCFLDEVGELGAATQAKLLRVLENGEVMRVGSLRSKRVDVRFIAATNRDLELLTREGRFREDLLFRLSGFVVAIPPLRMRTDDILPLARHFLGAFGARSGRAAPSLSGDVEALLKAHPWPGNARELRHAVERALALCNGPEIRPQHVVLGNAPMVGGPGAVVAPLGPVGGASERDTILAALGRNGGNQTQAARELGMPRRTLTRRLAEYGIARPRKR